ncbi:MAG: hypothetical protein GYA55_06505 [SAR324 cluster bacterium]|uniref:Uncharacterized protein n=1 Tax=SAR324 cluster bacterium TaxID=2024889 RepID=A0A7X9IK71_9DELT|nr:hypothetical protein [SAR324 cluster bacterium]
MRKTIEHLTPKQEALLERYFDNECGLLGRIRAASLLRNSESAKSFYTDLKSLNEGITSYGKRLPELSEDLWSKIEKGIDLGERLQFIEAEEKEWLGDFRRSVWEAWARMSWGAAGGVAVAVLLLVLIKSPDLNNTVNMAPVAVKSEARAVQLASDAPRNLNSGALLLGAAGLSPSFYRLRSGGRVKVTRKPTEHSTILWISKKPVETAVAPDKNRAGVFYLDPNMAVDPILQGD